MGDDHWRWTIRLPEKPPDRGWFRISRYENEVGSGSRIEPIIHAFESRQ
jgi:hypothetical protein